MGGCASKIKNKVRGKKAATPNGADTGKSPDAAPQPTPPPQQQQHSTGPHAPGENSRGDTLSIPTPTSLDEHSPHPDDPERKSEPGDVAGEPSPGAGAAADAPARLALDKTAAKPADGSSGSSENAQTSGSETASDGEEERSSSISSLAVDGETRQCELSGAAEGCSETERNAERADGDAIQGAAMEAQPPRWSTANVSTAPDALGSDGGGSLALPPATADRPNQLSRLGLEEAGAADALPPYEWVAVPARSQWERAKRLGESRNGSGVGFLSPVLHPAAPPLPSLRSGAGAETFQTSRPFAVYGEPRNGYEGGYERSISPFLLSHPNASARHADPVVAAAPAAPATTTPHPNTFYFHLPREQRTFAAVEDTTEEDGGDTGERSGSYSYSYSYMGSYYSDRSRSRSRSGSDSYDTYSDTSASSSAVSASSPFGRTPAYDLHEKRAAGSAGTALNGRSHDWVRGSYPSPSGATVAKDNTPVTYLFQTLVERPLGQRSVFQLDDLAY